MPTQTDIITASQTWVSPITGTVSLLGWGGGGGAGTNGNSKGGGEGGYCVEHTLSVTAGESIAVVIGAGGGQAVAGGDTTFRSGADYKAKGGAAGDGANGGGAVDQSASCVGTTVYRGQAGADTGGLAGSPGGKGGDAGNTAGGGGAGGVGGIGGITSPTDGTAPGGGGGGGARSQPAMSGARGELRITYAVAGGQTLLSGIGTSLLSCQE